MRRFDNRAAQVVAACGGSLFVLIGLAGLAQPQTGDRVQGLVWIAFGVLSIWRGWTTSNVVVRPDEIELRSIFRTRRVPLSALESVTVAVGRTGMNGDGREYLVMHRRDGGETAFKDLNSKPSSATETVVQQAAREITDALSG